MAEKPDKPAPAPAPAAEAAAPAEGGAKGGGIAGFLPLIVALVLGPAISFAVAQFVLLPKFKAEVAAAVAQQNPGEGGEPGHEPAAAKKPEPTKPAAHGDAKKPAGGHGDKKGDPKAVATEGPNAYKFDNVVVNLAGTMGTRYLKASFLVSGKNNLNELFEARKPELYDVTLNLLGSLTLADLEEVGSRNLIRARLMNAYNEALGGRIVEQIYFSDFIVQ